MATIFTKIINGESPGRFVWKDDQCVAFMTIAPIKPGHTLIVPRREIEHWLDLETASLNHLINVAQTIGRAIEAEWNPPKVGLMLAGLEVPHAHIHTLPIWESHDLDFANADPKVSGEALDDSARRIRDRLRAKGFRQVSE